MPGLVVAAAAAAAAGASAAPSGSSAEHAKFFNHLVDLIPARYYYEDDIERMNPKFMQKAARAAAKQQMKEAYKKGGCSGRSPVVLWRGWGQGGRLCGGPLVRACCGMARRAARAALALSTQGTCCGVPDSSAGDGGGTPRLGTAPPRCADGGAAPLTWDTQW